MNDQNIRVACRQIHHTLNRLSNHMIEVLTNKETTTAVGMDELASLHQAMEMGKKQIETFLADHGIVEF